MRFALIFSLFLLVSRPLLADGPSAQDVLEKARRASALGMVGVRAEVKLSVVDGKGGTKERRLTASALGLPTGEVRRLIRFHEPAEVRGVGFLVAEKPDGRTERWLYLPAQKRVRPVSSTAGAGSFQQTDFSYADLDLAGGAGDKHERLADTAVDGESCWQVATTPAQSPYGRIVTAVHQKTGVALQITYEGKDGTPQKRLVAKKVKQLQGRWYAAVAEMTTLATGSRTLLEITALDGAAKLSPDDFTEAALEQP